MRLIDADKLLNKAKPYIGEKNTEYAVPIKEIYDAATYTPTLCGSFATVKPEVRMCLNCGRAIEEGYMCECCAELD